MLSVPLFLTRSILSPTISSILSINSPNPGHRNWQQFLGQQRTASGRGTGTLPIVKACYSKRKGLSSSGSFKVRAPKAPVANELTPRRGATREKQKGRRRKQARKRESWVSPKGHKSPFTMPGCKAHVSERRKFAARMNETLWRTRSARSAGRCLASRSLLSSRCQLSSLVFPPVASETEAALFGLATRLEPGY